MAAIHNAVPGIVHEQRARLARRLTGSALTLAVLLTGVSSSAQTASRDETMNVARSRFQEGVAAFDSGHYELARAAFLQAYTLKKHPAILGNLAWSCLKSGHFLEAHDYFLQFLAENKEATPAQKADVTDGLAQADAKLGHIEVKAAPRSEVSIDGHHAGTAPLASSVAVEPGTHVVKITALDGSDSTQSVAVGPGETRTAQAGPSESELAGPTPPPPRVPSPAPSQESNEAEAKAQPQPQPQPQGQGSSFWPENMLPVYIGGGAFVAGVAVAIGAAVSKSSAQNNSNAEKQLIEAQNATCPAPAGSSAGLVTACNIFASDNLQWNQDATIANIGIGASIVALVGTAVYWIVAKKATQGPSEPSSASLLEIMPLVTPSLRGISLSTSF